MTTTRNAYRTCPVCNHYLARRAEAIGPAIALRSFIRGVAGEVVAHEYMTLVHARHLDGGSLSTRTFTPDVTTGTGTQIHVKRACNGCARALGDVTEAELDAAVTGGRMPDVRLECGCYKPKAA